VGFFSQILISISMCNENDGDNQVEDLQENFPAVYNFFCTKPIVKYNNVGDQIGKKDVI